MFDSMAKRTFRPAKASSRNLQPCGTKPCIGNVKAFMHFAKDGIGGQAAIVEFDDRIGIAPVRDIAITLADGHPGMILVDEKGSDLFLLAARRVFFTRG